jgi:hypothetical protein
VFDENLEAGCEAEALAERKSAKMRIAENARGAFNKNPLAWVIFGLLLVSMYGNYENGHHLTQVCEDIHDMMRERPFPPREAMAAWQKVEADEIEKICGDREADPRDDD